MKKTLIPALLASALLAATPSLSFAQAAPAAAAAQQGQASKAVMDASTRILTSLQQRRTEFRANPAVLRDFINSELNKTFDRDYAARLVLGVHGRGASDADGKPTFRLKSESPLPGNRGVRVSTELIRAGNEPTPVDYLMRNVNGQWKIFDVMIEGISYVQTFKTQFDAPLRQKSIQQVATELRNGSMQAGQAPRGK